MNVTLHTNHGDINVNLFPDHAPKTVENFVGLATGEKEWTDPRTGEKTSTPLYDGTIFHRIISGFMIQGGDPLGTGTGGPGYTFDDEIHPELTFSEPYILAMANAGKHRGQGHQRLAVLHHRGPDPAPAGQAHDLRRGRRRPEPRGRRQDRQRADRCDGQAPSTPSSSSPSPSRTTRPAGPGCGRARQTPEGTRMTEPMADQAAPVCPRHPDRVSYVRCQRCGRPTCPECQRPAAVGVQCVDCVRERASAPCARPARRSAARSATAGRSSR